MSGVFLRKPPLAERAAVLGRQLSLVIAVSLISSCAVLDASMLFQVAVAIPGGSSLGRPQIYGPKKRWFDRDFYFVRVVANSSDEAERAARSAAMESCILEGGTVEVVESESDHDSFRMRFRCANKVITHE